jgi:hypothetical protein
MEIDLDRAALEIEPGLGVVAGREHATGDQRVGAPQHDHLGVGLDHRPVRRHRHATPGDGRQNLGDRLAGVAAEIGRAAAIAVEETPQHRVCAVQVGMVGAPGALALVQRGVAVLLAHALDLSGDQRQGVVPADLDEIMGAAQGAVALLAILEELAAHHRRLHAGAVVEPVRHGVNQLVDGQVLRQRLDTDHLASLLDQPHRADRGVDEDAPVDDAAGAGGRLGQGWKQGKPGRRRNGASDQITAGEHVGMSWSRRAAGKNTRPAPGQAVALVNFPCRGCYGWGRPACR